jgi:hypothetical protein
MASNLCTDRWLISAIYGLCTDNWSIAPVIPFIPPVPTRRGHGKYISILDEDLTEEDALILATYYLIRSRWEL